MINVTTASTVSEASDTREAAEGRSATWENVQWLINDGGLPLPAGVSVHLDGYLILHFDALADGERWAEAMSLELMNGGVRRPTMPGKVITYYSGHFRERLVSLFVGEDASVLDEPTEPDLPPGVEVYDASVEDEPHVHGYVRRDELGYLADDPRCEGCCAAARKALADAKTPDPAPLPATLGCPRCSHTEYASEEDPDAGLGQMHNHILWEHADRDPDVTLALIAQVTAEAAS